MSATGMDGTAGPLQGLSPSGVAGPSRPSAIVLAVRILIVLVSAAALASPLYVALRGSSYLNQPPPPFWGVSAGTGSTGSTGATGVHATSGLGGC